MSKQNGTKREAEEPSKEDHSKSSDDDESDDGVPEDIVNVDFDFYNPDPVDFHALKRLLGQLFSSDNELIHLSDITDIIIEENHVGTTVKVDSQESDPYAILSAIHLNAQKCPKKEEKLHKAVSEILSLKDVSVGWIVSERFINMPVEIMPPMYSMLQQELTQAVEQDEPYVFEWYMFISKTYKEVMPTAEEDSSSEPKKKKAKKSSQDTETFYFQAEDEIIAKYATHHFDFRFTHSEKEAVSDAKRAFSDFGIAPSRKLLFVHTSQWESLVKEIEATCTNIVPLKDEEEE
ncbi:p21-C-terminal region-binding protein-domain-containing protein [Spinellus fusiger]|nr:p21-C-terminal region-binding protein-domain-containing protein [Spinellus fusiger]